MSRHARTLILASALLALTRAAHAAPAQNVDACPKQPGMIAGAVVPNQETARAIFTAVVKGYARGADFSEFTVEVQADGDGRSWNVFHANRNRNMRGGGLSMKIDRCTGAVRDFHGQR